MKKIKETEEKFKSFLNTYTLPEIKDNDKQETIDLLKTFMPIQQERTSELMKKLVWKAFIELLSYFKIQLLIITVLMFLIYTILPETMERWIFFVLTTPAPLLGVGWYLMNAQTAGMVELESTYKYSFQQILFSKIVAITVCSIAIYSCTLLYMILIHHVELSTAIFHIAVLGLTPILLLCLTLLSLSIRYRDAMSWTVIILIWIFFVLLSIYTPMGTILLSMNSLIYILINVMLLVFFIYRLANVWRMERLPNEYH
ncbi:hypothetical protein [Lysinibacillus agricola]|uniref:hypothetical protein n=1 Tax=Lysinibacillus agricola TaxID=2590012 RepID=UPI003C1EE91D